MSGANYFFRILWISMSLEATQFKQLKPSSRALIQAGAKPISLSYRTLASSTRIGALVKACCHPCADCL